MSAFMKANRLFPATLAILLGWALPGHAILFHATGDPAHNTNAPGGTLTNSGWQYTGRWGGFLGTVIGSRYFITAKHIATGDTGAGHLFLFQGRAYTALTNYDDPNSDLRIWRVCGTFPPPYAPLYTAGVEVNRGVILIGRGTRRGAEVRTSPGGLLKGWAWGEYDGVQRWGSNKVHSTVNGGPGLNTLLVLKFDANAGPDEGHLSNGDSGGGVFVRDGSVWKLAGINYAADGFYSTNGADPGLFAAVFDEGGLYRFSQSTMAWVPILDTGLDVPGSSYATRIADVARVSWINSILNQSVPPDPLPVLQSASAVDAVYANEPDAMINGVNGAITLPAAGIKRFYRLSGCGSYRITGIVINGSNVVLTYE